MDVWSIKGWQTRRGRGKRAQIKRPGHPLSAVWPRPLCIGDGVGDTFLLWVIDYRAGFSTSTSHRWGRDVDPVRWLDLPYTPLHSQTKSRLGWHKHDLVMLGRVTTIASLIACSRGLVRTKYLRLWSNLCCRTLGMNLNRHCLNKLIYTVELHCTSQRGWAFLGSNVLNLGFMSNIMLPTPTTSAYNTHWCLHWLTLVSEFRLI